MPKPPLSFAFQGSGLLLPFYFGVVQGLQDSKVLTPEVARTASFGGLSGGAITSVLTAAGWQGSKMLQLWDEVFAAVGACAMKFHGDHLEASLQCAFNSIALPIIGRLLLETATEAEVLAAVNGRVNVWACQVNPLGTTIANSVTQRTNKFTSLEDLLSALRSSDAVREREGEKNAHGLGEKGARPPVGGGGGGGGGEKVQGR